MSAAGILPLIAAALLMQIFSDLLRKQLAQVLGVKGYVYLTAPGVMIHELSHAAFCIIFRHQIVEMKLFDPQADGTLGYVNHAYNKHNIYHRIGNFFIGTGPIWGGCLVLMVISRMLLPDCMRGGDSFAEYCQAFIAGALTPDFWMRWQSWLWIYLTLTIASHITLSLPDLQGAADGLIVIIAAVILGNILLGWSGNWAEFIWQYEFALLSELSIALIGTFLTGIFMITILRCIGKR